MLMWACVCVGSYWWCLLVELVVGCLWRLLDNLWKVLVCGMCELGG